MTWLPFSYSNLDVTMYRGWRKNDSWAIRVRYNWKFDIVLQRLRRLQYISLINDAIETIFAWRDYYFLIQIWTWPCIEVDGKNDSLAIRVRYNWNIDIVFQSLRRIQYICMNADAIETIFAWRDYYFFIQIWTWPCIEVDGKIIRGRFGWGIIQSLTLFFKACVVYNISAWISMRYKHDLHDVTTIFFFKFGQDHV